MKTLPTVSALNSSYHIFSSSSVSLAQDRIEVKKFSLYDFLVFAIKSSIFYTFFLLFTAPVE
ncbi:hypothetical protein M1403_00690 [Patescibacteria group bacterium]|nr:hypothetical protein [Patescibacteria group bacterium]